MPRTRNRLEYDPADLAHAMVVPNDADGRGDLVAAMEASKRRARGAQKAPTKVSVTIRYDRGTIAAYKATGRGWQTRLAADVRMLAKRRAARLASR